MSNNKFREPLYAEFADPITREEFERLAYGKFPPKEPLLTEERAARLSGRITAEVLGRLRSRNHVLTALNGDKGDVMLESEMRELVEDVLRREPK